jgi:hypothetical protein
MNADQTRCRKLPLWAGLVEAAVRSAEGRGEPFTETMLDSVGIFAWSPYRARALSYAQKIIAAGSSSGGSHDNAQA